MNKEKEKHSYCFPDFMAKAMKKVDFRTQLEASMLSQFLLIIGLTLMVIMNLVAGSGNLWTKIIVTFNLICGWVLISSYLVTTYQQYTSYMNARGFDAREEKKESRLKGNLIQRIIKHRKIKRARNKMISKETISIEREDVL